MRKAAFWTALFVVLAFVTGAAFAAPPDSVVLKIGKSRPPVLFFHKAHGEKFLVACDNCHHGSPAGAEKKCSKCHGAKAKGKKLALKDAFHTQCKKCHETQKKGPVKCAACHKPGKK